MVGLTGDDMCFACGKDNPIGLKLEFMAISENLIETSFIPKPEHQSYDGILHGGLMATLLDEAMGKLLRLKEMNALTARFEMRYRKSAVIGERLWIKGRILSQRGRMIEMAAEAVNDNQEILAEATGRFMRVPTSS